MKKRLTRKLFLSLAAMGVTAATLTTSTFAWYTANTEAKVNTITASTESKGSDSLFIATAGSYDSDRAGADWGGYIAEVTPILNGTNHVLAPVYSNFGTAAIKKATTDPVAEAVAGRSYNKIGATKAAYAATADETVQSGKTYYTDDTGATVSTAAVGASATGLFEKTNDTVEYKDESVSDFLEFVIRVRSGNVLAAETPLYFSKFDITPSSTDASQIALAKSGNTGVDGAGLYSASILKALKLDVTSAPVTLGDNSAIPDLAVTKRAVATETLVPTTYGFESFAPANSDVNLTVTDTNNAIGYYNTVMSKNIARPTSDYVSGTELYKNATQTATNALVVANLPKTADGKDFSVVEIRFVLYLDGWDNYCYDIMQGQTVNFSFSLTTDKTKSIITSTNPNA